MKRALLLFAVLVCLAGRARGQAEIPHFASAPATCDPTRGQIYYDTTLKALQVCTATNTWAGGSSSSSSQGPVINVTNPIYAGGASSSLADNNAAFTAAAAAAVTAVTVGTGVPAFKTSAFANCPATCTSQAVTINVAPGDTVLLHVSGVNNANTITATDTGGNSYYQIYSWPGGNWPLNVLGTNPSGATAAATSITVTESGAAAAWGVIASTYSNVGSYRYWPKLSATTSTTQTQSLTTNYANDLIVTGFVWFSGGADAASQSAGTLQNTFPATASVGGAAIVTQSAATAGTAFSNTITLAVTSQTGIESLELRGISDVIPTVYIPYAAKPYQYSGGLSFVLPATLRCEMGAALAYTGSAHAVDVGPPGLVFATSQKQYNVIGCMFTNGQKMTEGIYLQPAIEWPGISYNTFYNFGNATSHMITSSQENWDVEVGPQNRFIIDDGQPRPVLIMNQNHFSQDSFLRFHDNAMWCLPQLQNVGCDVAQSAVGIVADGATNRIYHNNMMFWNPPIQFICSNSPPCQNNQADQNQIEAPGTGVTSVAQIRFDNQIGLLVTQNTISMHFTGASAVGPVNGTSTLASARINFNTIEGIALATPLVALNNVVSQGGNQSFGNECSTSVGPPYLPCALLHTAGGNIAQWGSDNYPTCTLVAGTCTATLSQNYGVLPKCTGTWNGAGALAGILKVVPTAGNPNTVVVTSSNGADTAGVQLSCSAGDAQ